MSTIILYKVTEKTNEKAPDWSGLILDGDEKVGRVAAWVKWAASGKQYLNVTTEVEDKDRIFGAIFSDDGKYSGILNDTPGHITKMSVTKKSNKSGEPMLVCETDYSFTNSKKQQSSKKSSKEVF